jgi:glycogen operon protein
MTGADWADPGARAVAIHLEGQDAPDRAADGTPLVDDDFLVLVNGWWETLDFILPAACAGQVWPAEIDSFDPAATARHGKPSAGERVSVGPRAVLVLRGSAPRGPVSGDR